MAGVEFRHVYKSYRNFDAVRDFNLTIADREFLVLVGPSGCGKSTTLRLIAGLEEVSQGEILIDGRVVNDVPPKARDIAMVFQDYALYPHMTVFENMSFSLRLRRLPKETIRTKVLQAAKILGIEELLHRRPKALSGGQRQRVAMGRAIVREPKVFLFDEPLSNLDAKLRVQMRVEISQLHQRLQTTIVYVTHDQVEAMTLADRIVVMVKGVIQQTGTPMELFEHPTNAFVGGFIGSPAMNFLRVELVREQGQLYLRGQSFKIPLPAHLKAPAEAPNQELLLGIRPQQISPRAQANEKTIPGTIEVIEPMGTETLIHFKLDAADQERLLAVTEPQRDEGLVFHLVAQPNMIASARGNVEFKVGERIHFEVPPQLHLFALQGELKCWA